MANSGTVTAGSAALASQYNNLRDDVLNITTGHTHTGASENGAKIEGTALKSTGVSNGFLLTANGSGAVTFTAAPAAGLTPTSFYQYTGASSTSLTNFLTKTGAAGAQNRSGQNSIHFTKFMPLQNFTVSNLALVCSDVGTAFASQTLVRFGIYTRSGSTFTLVARTASDVTIFGVAGTKYTRALSTVGGYPATYAMTAGSEYWIALTMQFSSGNGCSAVCTPSAVSGFNDVYLSGGADLTTTATGTANAAQAVFWEVS
jgi:hypothetical protein